MHSFTEFARMLVERIAPMPRQGLKTLLTVVLSGLFQLVVVRSGEARVEAEALIGQPFGVGQVTISGPDAAIDLSRVTIEEKNGRVFYPAATQGVLGRLFGQIVGGADRQVAGVTIHFLFRGTEPLELTVHTPQAMTFVLAPRNDNPRGFDRQFTQWWRQYNACWRQLRTEDDHPALVPTYLT